MPAVLHPTTPESRAPVDESYQMLADTFREALEVDVKKRRKSPRTLKAYMDAVQLLGQYLADHRLPQAVSRIRARDIDQFLVSLADRGNKPATVNNRYRSLRPFFRWLEREGYIDRNPVDQVEAPGVPEEEVDIPTDDQIKRLLATCEGKGKTTFRDRRDAAIIRVFLDTGMRRSEMAGLKLGRQGDEGEDSDVDTRGHLVHLMGKGSKPRTLNINSKAVLALRHYLMTRRRHHDPRRPELWLGMGGSGHQSAMGHDGIAQVVRRRAQEAGFSLHAHQLRHKFADTWLRSGGSESDLMKIMGWTDPAMLRRYASALAAARAREAHQRLAIGDLF